ncbi:MRN complex-interacting protein [Amphiprion ocellaris]|uniref:MRN complex-interacting protein n=1 Tax=Amphiprion ocellaris TaxID=80972 RepID=UPI002410C64C|nr:MRN complex-interacting protein [Amphiprion ocellaris]
MVQEFHVVRCFSCQSFQVQQVKKVNRWSCKLCGEKQSLLKEYGRGSGADCRRHVQKLNAIRGAMMEEQEDNTWSIWEQQVEAEEQKQGDDQVTQTQVSRWSKYLDTPKEAELEEEEEPEWNVLMDRQQLHGNMTDREYSISKRKRMEEKTDGWEDSCSPDQSACLKRKPGRPSATNSPLSQRVTSLPSQRVSSSLSQRVTSPPSQRFTSLPSQRVTSPPSQRVTSLPSQRVTSPPSQRFTSLPSQRVTSPPSQRVTSSPSQRVSSSPSQRVSSSPSQRVTSPPSQRVSSSPSQRVTSPPSQRVSSSPSQRVTSPPSQRVTSPPSQRVTSPPSKDTSLPGVSSVTASSCAHFLSADCQVQLAKGSPVGGWSQCIGGATAMSHPDLAKPRLQLPVSSMFESGEDFSFDDDDFLTCQRV